jgi:hypothetical protein
MSNRKAFVEKINEHLFSDDKTRLKVFSKPEQDMILRYRAAFVKWLDDWSLEDKQMVRYLIETYNISKSVAYTDIANIKFLIGNVKTAGKEFQRYRANEMVVKAFKLAERAETSLEIKKAEAMVRAASAMVKVHKLHIEEGEALPWDEIIPADFEVTGDVSVLGIKPLKNLKELQANLRSKYMRELKVNDIGFELVNPASDV